MALNEEDELFSDTKGFKNSIKSRPLLLNQSSRGGIRDTVQSQELKTMQVVGQQPDGHGEMLDQAHLGHEHVYEPLGLPAALRERSEKESTETNEACPPMQVKFRDSLPQSHMYYGPDQNYENQVLGPMQRLESGP